MVYKEKENKRTTTHIPPLSWGSTSIRTFSRHRISTIYEQRDSSGKLINLDPRRQKRMIWGRTSKRTSTRVKRRIFNSNDKVPEQRESSEQRDSSELQIPENHTEQRQTSRELDRQRLTNWRQRISSEQAARNLRRQLEQEQLRLANMTQREYTARLARRRIKLIRAAKLIIWDEAPMTHRHAFEAVNRTLIDILGVDLPFGGKIMVIGGDFRQVLPVIPKGTRAETVAASVVKSPLWKHVHVLRLTENMRGRNDKYFADFLLRVGDGLEPSNEDDLIKVPDTMVIPYKGTQSIDTLIAQIYPNLCNHTNDASYMLGRAVITPLNNDVNKINDRVIMNFTGEVKIYHSFDKVEDDTYNRYSQEFLNSISPSGMPPHVLHLKVGAPIMLLRNIAPSNGLCNGTRLICRSLNRNFIDAEILDGPYKGTRAFLHRIPLKTPDSMRLSFKMIRTQFPVRLSFALTINKSQGQTIPHVGVYLPDNVFSHGQLYVALSRGVSQQKTKVLVEKNTNRSNADVRTRNVVYPDVLLRNQ